MSRRRRQAHEEEHENHERWLITYADMITLLMVLFIVLFAMSTVEEKKFNALKDGLAAGFGQSTSILDGSDAVLDQSGVAAVEPVMPSRFLTPRSSDSPPVNDALQEQTQEQYDAAAAEADRLQDIEKRILDALRSQHLQNDVQTVIDGRGLTISLVSRHVVFEANLATLTPRGRQIVDTIAPVLREVDDELAIEGHTNQAPGAPKYYASDWDLSAARAVTVLRYLNEQKGIPAERLSAVGFGKVRPLVDPSKPGSQMLNKRVDIVVQSALAADNQELLGQVMYDRTHGEGSADDRGSTDSGTSSDNTDNTDASGDSGSVVRTGKGTS